MRSFIVRSIGVVLVCSFIGAVIWGLYWSMASIWDALISVDAKLAVGVVAAVTTVLGATLTVTVGKYLERKHAVEAAFRERKVEIYDGFLVEFFKLIGQDGQPDDSGLVDFLQAWRRKLVVWGGAGVLLSYKNWQSHLLSKGDEPDAESMFLMGDFLLAIRKDLGLSNKGMDRRVFAHLILRNPNLFLELSKNNPKITIAEIARIEESLDSSGD